MPGLIAVIDKNVKWMVWFSIASLFLELSFKRSNSLDSGMFLFLWMERLTATVFMVEYVARFADKGKKYVFSAMGAVDLISWLPFLVGFFIPVHLLGWVRALRVLRLLKQFRYDRRLQIFVLAIYRARNLIKPIMFVSVCISLFSSVLLYEAEKAAQPDTFGSIWNILCWHIPVTGTTVGFGDTFPITNVGKFCSVVFVLFPLISIVGCMIGVLGSQFQQCIEDEKNPDFDPLKEFT
jgi:voltage-gated potassium channel